MDAHTRDRVLEILLAHGARRRRGGGCPSSPFLPLSLSPSPPLSLSPPRSLSLCRLCLLPIFSLSPCLPPSFSPRLRRCHAWPLLPLRASPLDSDDGAAGRPGGGRPRGGHAWPSLPRGAVAPPGEGGLAATQVRGDHDGGAVLPRRAGVVHRRRSDERFCAGREGCHRGRLALVFVVSRTRVQPAAQ